MVEICVSLKKKKKTLFLKNTKDTNISTITIKKKHRSLKTYKIQTFQQITITDTKKNIFP